MAIVVPEIILKTLLDGVLSEIREDFADENDEKKSVLYKLFGGVKIGKWDYFEQARDLFLREKDHPRRLDTRLFFDATRTSIPTMHITMPAENASGDGFGIDEGYQEGTFDPVKQEYTPTFTRMFNTRYHIIITSDNTLEVLLIYHCVRALLISIFESIELSGLRNPKLSGQDIKINSELVPPHIFMRGIGLDVSYEVDVPRFYDEKVISKIIIGTGTPSVPDNC